LILIRNQIYLIFLTFFVFFNIIDSYQQQADSNNNETQISVEISIDETEDNKTDRTITISGGSSDVRNIIDKVVESEFEKTVEDVPKKLGFQNSDELEEKMKTEPTFEVKITVKIDQNIPDNIITISLRSAHNYENQEIDVRDGEKQNLEFHVNDYLYSEYDVCAIGKITKDVYDCNSGQYDDAVEKVSLKVEQD
jgi:hypothetical protein